MFFSIGDLSYFIYSYFFYLSQICSEIKVNFRVIWEFFKDNAEFVVRNQNKSLESLQIEMDASQTIPQQTATLELFKQEITKFSRESSSEEVKTLSNTLICIMAIID